MKLLLHIIAGIALGCLFNLMGGTKFGTPDYVVGPMCFTVIACVWWAFYRKKSGLFL